ADADLLRVVHEVDEIAERAVLRMDAVEVRDVVSVVAIRRRIERLQPDARHAQPGQVVEPPRQSGEVPDAVAVAVHVRLDVKAVDDGVLVPQVIDHDGASPSLAPRAPNPAVGYSSGACLN